MHSRRWRTGCFEKKESIIRCGWVVYERMMIWMMICMNVWMNEWTKVIISYPDYTERESRARGDCMAFGCSFSFPLSLVSYYIVIVWTIGRRDETMSTLFLMSLYLPSFERVQASMMQYRKEYWMIMQQLNFSLCVHWCMNVPQNKRIRSGTKRK